MVKEMDRKLAITCDVFSMLMFFKLLANYDTQDPQITAALLAVIMLNILIQIQISLTTLSYYEIFKYFQ